MGKKCDGYEAVYEIKPRSPSYGAKQTAFFAALPSPKIKTVLTV